VAVDERLSRHPEVAWFGDEHRIATVRLDRPADDPVLVAGGAVAIWRALGEPLALGQLIDLVAERVGLEPGAIAADIHSFVEEALRSGLLVRLDQSAATGDR
jgi:hypothetical protein